MDLDLLNKTTKIFNYKTMKIFSYHEQLGDHVQLITDDAFFTNNYDVLYLIREYRNSPILYPNALDDDRTILIGEGFQFYENVKDLTREMAVCRPKYSLFPEDPENIYSRANYAQFVQDKSVLLRTQDWHRNRAYLTIVVDKDFWKMSNPMIIKCMDSLKLESGVLFLGTISMKKLLNPEIFNRFITLKLAKNLKLKYNNDIGEDYESAKLAIDLAAKLKIQYHLNVPHITFKIITHNHFTDPNSILYDFKRNMQIMAYAQTKRVRVNMKYPRLRQSSPRWYYFEFFKHWSNHRHTRSFVEAMLRDSAAFEGLAYYEVLNNDKYWVTDRIKRVVYLIAVMENFIKEYGFVMWGGNISNSIKLVDFEYVRRKAIENYIFRP